MAAPSLGDAKKVDAQAPQRIISLHGEFGAIRRVMYKINGSQLTAQGDITVDVYLVCSPPPSLIDNNAKTPRVPMGVTRKLFTLRNGEVLGGVVSVVGCNPVEALKHK